MSKKLLTLIIIGMVSLGLTACGKEATEEPAKEDGAKEEAEMLPAGENALGFANSSTELVAGDHAFAPDYENALKLRTKGAEVSYITYNWVEVATPGELETTVKDEWGAEGKKEYAVQNSFLIPVPKGATASKGDIVITPWVSGLMRALVTEGDNTATPKVVWIDDIDDSKTVEADSFTVLSKDWDPGTSVACQGESTDYELATLIKVVEDEVLTSGWAGTPKIYSKTKCKPVPVTPDVKEGDKVFVAPFGTFEEGTIKTIKADDGKVVVEYEFAGEMEEEKFPFGDVLLEL